MRHLQVLNPSPVVVCCDNKSASHIAADPVIHEQTKHTKIVYNVVLDKIQARFVIFVAYHIQGPSGKYSHQVSPSWPFSSLHSKLETIDIHYSLREGVNLIVMELVS